MGGKIWIAVAGLLGAVGVGMGAYASHGLGFIEDATVREATRATLQTAQLRRQLTQVGVLRRQLGPLRRVEQLQQRGIQLPGQLLQLCLALRAVLGQALPFLVLWQAVALRAQQLRRTTEKATLLQQALQAFAERGQRLGRLAQVALFQFILHA